MDERRLQGCAEHCDCQHVFHFNPVNYDGVTYFSPCHAGCTNYDPINRAVSGFSSSQPQWTECACSSYSTINTGIQHNSCDFSMYGYLFILFVGLFAGNLFFMTTMMIVLRCVFALSFLFPAARCMTTRR